MDRIARLFARHNLRHTRQREAVYLALESSDTQPSADELQVLVRLRLPSISLATVYNTLDILVRKGLARRVTPANLTASATVASAAARFDANPAARVQLTDEHGRIRDLPPDLDQRLIDSISADVLDAIEKRMGVRIDSVRVELAGQATGGKAC